MNGELYPGEFDVMEHNGRLDAVIPEQKIMTKEEAIARIKDHMIVHKMYEPRAVYISEALEMAIEALDKCDKIEKIIDSNDADFIANYVSGLFAE